MIRVPTIVTVSVIICSYSHICKNFFLNIKWGRRMDRFGDLGCIIDIQNLLFLLNLSFHLQMLHITKLKYIWWCSLCVTRSFRTRSRNCSTCCCTSCVRAGQLSSGHVHMLFLIDENGNTWSIKSVSYFNQQMARVIYPPIIAWTAKILI